MIKNFLSKRNILVSLTLLFVFLGFRIYSSYAKANDFETVEVKKSSLNQTVFASGEIESDNEVELKFPISGKLVSLVVDKNEKVKKGEFIASLDITSLSIALQEAQNTLKSKQAAAEKAEDDVKNHSNDETYTQKQTRTEAQVARDNAYDTVRAAQQAIRDASLFSPIAGVVTKVHSQVGTSIVAGSTPIVTIANPENIFFIAKVGESDIANILPNQKTIVELDAFPDKKFSGKVVEVDYAATVTNGNKAYFVKIALDEKDKIKLDMSGEAEITTSLKENVLVIPKLTIQEKDNQKIVEVVENGNVVEKEVKTGLTGKGGIIEILSGLVERDKVILPKN